METHKQLSPDQRESLLHTLQARFNKHIKRHAGLDWTLIQAKLEASPEKLWGLSGMEASGGEPDVIGVDETTGDYLFVDCSAESPAGRRNLCYDPAGQAAREKQGIQPKGNVLDMAQALGIELLNEAQYRALQQVGTFDAKTSSWILTPADIHQRGGALFADYRYGHVFVYHNSAPSFYSSRGFRGCLRV